LSLWQEKVSRYFKRLSECSTDGLEVDHMREREHTQNLLIFQVSRLNCAFPLETVQEIAPMAALSSPPGMPSGLAGFLDLRGIAIPIVRLDRLFDIPEQLPGLHTPIIILHGAAGPMGVLVDYVRSIVPVSPSQLLGIPEERTLGGCVTADVQLDGDLVHLLSPAALLEANEDRLLADYCSMSQARLLQLEETT
jgi:purine-binding chemotaxis protein CheW